MDGSTGDGAGPGGQTLTGHPSRAAATRAMTGIAVSLGAPPPLEVGFKVECRFEGGAEFYPGTIAAVNREDGTFNVDYDDGDKEEGVGASMITAAGNVRR